MLAELLDQQHDRISALPASSTIPAGFRPGPAELARKYEGSEGRILAWLMLAEAVNYWINLGRVSPRLMIRNDGRPVIRIGNATVSESVSLLGALALQMMFFAVSGKDVYWCDNCGEQFTLQEGERRRNPNQAVWCKACGKKAADKPSRRRYNALTPKERAQRRRERERRARERTKLAEKRRRKGAHRGRKTTRAR